MGRPRCEVPARIGPFLDKYPWGSLTFWPDPALEMWLRARARAACPRHPGLTLGAGRGHRGGLFGNLLRFALLKGHRRLADGRLRADGRSGRSGRE